MQRSVVTLCANKKFEGCEAFSSTRMTWIKTNFLWMMFRSGWGTKKNQEITLAIWLKRSAFDEYISLASTKGGSKSNDGKIVRLQWDPGNLPLSVGVGILINRTDHSPRGGTVTRRAIQLGLKQAASFMNGEDIIDIQDITTFVKGADRSDPNFKNLITPRETVYRVTDPKTHASLQISNWDDTTVTDATKKDEDQQEKED